MEVVADDPKLGKLLVGDRDLLALRIQGGIEGSVDHKPRAVARVGDEIDDDLQAHQRPATPVLRDEGEETMLDLIPLACARRQMTNADPETVLVGETLQLALPQPYPRAVGPSAIGDDKQLLGLRVAIRAHEVPPGAERGNYEFGRVVIDSDADPAHVGRQVVDAVRVHAKIG